MEQEELSTMLEVAHRVRDLTTDQGGGAVATNASDSSDSTRRALSNLRQRLIEYGVEFFDEGLQGLLNGLAAEVSNDAAAALSGPWPVDSVRAWFDLAADALIWGQKHTKRAIDELVTDIVKAAHAPDWVANMTGQVVAKLAVKPVEQPMQLVALSLRVTGWVLEHELAQYRKMLVAEAGADPSAVVERVRAQLGEPDNYKDALRGLFSEGFEKELDLLFRLEPVDWTAVRDLVFGEADEAEEFPEFPEVAVEQQDGPARTASELGRREEPGLPLPDEVLGSGWWGPGSKGQEGPDPGP